MLLRESAELPIDHVEDFLGALSGDFLDPVPWRGVGVWNS